MEFERVNQQSSEVEPVVPDSAIAARVRTILNTVGRFGSSTGKEGLNKIFQNARDPEKALLNLYGTWKIVADQS